MHISRLLSHLVRPVLSLAVLAAVATAQVTVATVQLGGLGTVGSEGGNPPTLSDGTTVATGTLTYTYDSSSGQLQVQVDNTTADVPGNPNPLITSVYFNVPHAAVTGLTLLSQTGGPNGAPPAFTIVFDADVTSNPNPNGADGLGAYSVGLYEPAGGGIEGIANPGAAFWVRPLSLIYEGPVVFTFQCAGPTLGTLTADSFADALSWIPPGSHSCQAAAHFQAGGASGAFSAFIGTTTQCVPGLWTWGTSCLGDVVHIVMSAQPGCHGCLVAGLVPGPTQIGGILAPFAPPYFVLASQTPQNTPFVDVPLFIPFNPTLVGMVVYFGVVVFDPLGGGLPEFSSVVTITICP